MLSNLKESVNKRQADIFLAAFIVLIALISFGLGHLTANQTKKEPIVIQQPTAALEAPAPSNSSNQNEIKPRPTQEKIFVASVKGAKYHWPNCPSAKKISPENQIWFSSETEAKAAGYTRCANFEKYAPPDYKP